MTNATHDAVFAAIEKAVNAAIFQIGGIDALKQTSMFPSNRNRTTAMKKAA